MTTDVDAPFGEDALDDFLSSLPGANDGEDDGEDDGDGVDGVDDDVWSSLDAHLATFDGRGRGGEDRGGDGARLGGARASGAKSQTYMREGAEVVNHAMMAATGVTSMSGDPSVQEVSNALKRVLEGVSGGSATNPRDGCLAQLWMAEVRENDVVLCCHKEFVRVNSTQRADLLWTYHDSWKLFFFNTSLSGTEAFLGAPGRVFSAKEPEYTPSTQCYSASEFSRHVLAQQCGIHTSLTVPIGVRGDANRPIGVLEISFNHVVDSIGRVYADVVREINAHGLSTVESMRMAPREVLSAAIASDLSSIDVVATNAALQACCQAWDIPFAQIWIPYDDGKTCGLITSSAPFYQSSGYYQHLRDAASNVNLDARKGLAGKIWSKGSMVWVHDMNKLSHRDFALKHSCGLLKLRGFCMTKIALRTVSMREPLKVVLEVYLNPNLKTPREQAKIVQGFWTSVERYLEATVCTHTDREWLEEMKQVQVSNNASLASLDGGSGLMSSEVRTEGGALWGITLDVLQQNFHKHLKQAASDLGVGSTTLKRICRHYGISRWPRRSLTSKQGKLKEIMNRSTGGGTLDATDTLMGSQDVSQMRESFGRMGEGESVHGASAMSFASASGSLEHSIHGGTAGIPSHPYAPDGILLSPSGSESYKRGLEERVHRGSHLGALWAGTERNKQQRGTSWHGNSSARLALNDDFLTRFEQSVHGTHNFGMPPAPMDRSVHGVHQVERTAEQLREEIVNFFDEFVSEPETSSLVVKVHFLKDIIRIRLRTASRHDELMTTLGRILNVNLDAVKIKYKDDEGDWCLLRSQEDFDDCLAFCQKYSPSSVMRVKLAISEEINADQVYRTEQIAPECSKSDGGTINVKASFGEDVIRFKLTPTMTFADVMVKWSGVAPSTSSNISLEYLDDQDEWVRLGGNIDLNESRESSAATGALRFRAAR